MTATNAGQYGISLSGTYNTVDTSLIGISAKDEWDCNSVPSGNGSHGIFIPGGANHNTIQNTDIGCNGGNGVEVESSVTDGNHTFGPNNRIGTSDMVSLGNWGYGIDLGTDWNIVHSSTIYDNQSGGVGIASSSNNVYGNFVDYNNLNGIQIYGTVANNKIGCTVDCFFFGSIIGNIFMDNFGPGLLITGTSVSNTYVMGNRFGMDGGGGAQWNTAEGIFIYGSSANIIGDGLSSRYLNWIGAQKYADNIRLDGGASSNSISNNWIYNSGYYGVRITGGSHDNTIGGSSAACGNYIAGNTLDGVYISGNNNTINANRIYANSNGVHLSGSSTNNTIGFNVTASNFIAGNSADGITVDGTAHGNTIGTNYIGTDPSVYSAGNTGNGISIYGSAHDNVIGGAYGTNVIYFNQQNGIVLSGALVMNNIVSWNDIEKNSQNGLFITNGAHNNTIGYSVLYGNHQNGIELKDTNTNNNVISGTLVYSNTLNGINEHNSAAKNPWTQISTYQDGGLGIFKAVNSFIPVITTVTKSGGNVTVSGMASPSWLGSQTVTVELYATYLDADGVAEGKTFRGSTSTGFGSGVWSITFLASSTGCYVAFQTLYDFASNSNTSSEFSSNSCSLFLPLIKR